MHLLGIGTAVPAFCVRQSDAARFAVSTCSRDEEETRKCEIIYGYSGVETRHSVILTASDGEPDQRQSFYGAESPSTARRMEVYEREAGALAARACEAAISRAGIAPAAISHLVTISCSGFAAPGVDLELMGRFGLDPGVARTHVGYMGCHGAINGLRVADAFTRADPSATVLLCAVELCTLHHQYGWDAEKVVANALFADGAAAIVGCGRTPTGSRNARLIATGSRVFADSADAMAWRIGDHGFLMSLSKEVPSLIAANLRPWLEDWLMRLGLRIEDVQSWAVHPGGPRILSAVGEALGLPRERLAASYRILASHGNMSSPTVLFILDELWRQGTGGPSLALAFGPGLTAEAALFESPLP